MLVFYNSATIARAAFRRLGWEFRQWHVGAFQAFSLVGENTCLSIATATQPLLQLEHWKCSLDFSLHLLTRGYLGCGFEA